MEIKFGKHKGKKLTEVPADYLTWLIENSNTSDPKYGDANKKMVQACQDELNRRSDGGRQETREVKVSSFDPAVLAMLSKMLNTISADVKEIKEKLVKEDAPF